MNEYGQADNKTRERILRYIDLQQRISFQRIMKDLKINEGTLRYHLRVLLKEGSVGTAKEDGKRMYYARGITFGSIRNKTSELSRTEERVLTIISEYPTCSRKDILNSMEIGGRDLDRVLSRLEAGHRIWKIKEEGRVFFEEVTADGIKERMLLELALMFLDRRIDEKTFLRMKERIERDGL